MFEYQITGPISLVSECIECSSADFTILVLIKDVYSFYCSHTGQVHGSFCRSTELVGALSTLCEEHKYSNHFIFNAFHSHRTLISHTW